MTTGKNRFKQLTVLSRDWNRTEKNRFWNLKTIKILGTELKYFQVT